MDIKIVRDFIKKAQKFMRMANDSEYNYLANYRPTKVFTGHQHQGKTIEEIGDCDDNLPKGLIEINITDDTNLEHWCGNIKYVYWVSIFFDQLIAVRLNNATITINNTKYTGDNFMFHFSSGYSEDLIHECGLALVFCGRLSGDNYSAFISLPEGQVAHHPASDLGLGTAQWCSSRGFKKTLRQHQARPLSQITFSNLIQI